MDGAAFAYGGEGSTRLVNCTLTVEPGEVVAVVGSLGSGKSSLIRALLGEMAMVGGGGGEQQQSPPQPQGAAVPAAAKRQGGEARVYGSVAYVPQTPWVPNEAFRSVRGRGCVRF